MSEKVMMPKALTAENGAKALLQGEFFETKKIDCCDCFGDGCETCDGKGYEVLKVHVSWNTIKAIYKMAVGHLSFSSDEEDVDIII